MPLIRFEIFHGEEMTSNESIASFEINQINLTIQTSTEDILKLTTSFNSILLFDTRPNTDSKFTVCTFFFLNKKRDSKIIIGYSQI